MVRQTPQSSIRSETSVLLRFCLTGCSVINSITNYSSNPNPLVFLNPPIFVLCSLENHKGSLKQILDSEWWGSSSWGEWWLNLDSWTSKPGKPLSLSRCHQFVPPPPPPARRDLFWEGGVGVQLWKQAWDPLDCSCVLARLHRISAVAPLFTSWFLSDQWLCSANQNYPPPGTNCFISVESDLPAELGLENLTFSPLCFKAKYHKWTWYM